MKFKIEWFYYIVNTILRKQNSYSNKELENASITLNAKIMRSWVSNCNEYMDWLIEKDVIELTDNHSAGHSSRKYRFSEFIMGLLKKDLEIIVTELENLNSGNVILEKSIQESSVYAENEHLLKWFNDKLVIDFEGAKNYIQDVIFYESEYFDLKFKKVHWNYQILALHHKVFYATRNEESDFRLHTVLTSLKKLFKPFVTYGGREIIGYDLKNSQPFFLVFLIESIMNNNSKIDNILSRTYNKSYYNSYMLQKITQTICSKEFQDEYEVFRFWVLDGRIYENMTEIIAPDKHLRKYCNYKYDERLNYKIREIHYSLRNMMKGVFFTLLFCGVKTKDKHYHTFKRAFPNLVGLIEIFKMKKNSDFSKLLQNIESECIIDFVTKKIAEQYPEMPLFTIHDSVSTTVEYGEVLKTLMPYYISQFTGLTPKIEEEKWKKHDYQVDYKKRVELHPEWYAYNGF
ncbi:hypothetical protein [Chryseobacterium sp. CBo1]|uniref:hypothetical protein n=1 Tax=Chryseobacterium sp. CBo1 TaxID=1869230 RepID=UPI000F4F9012|nr:hypothetical protein [Chryseobacterium sp. CBo1]